MGKTKQISKDTKKRQRLSVVVVPSRAGKSLLAKSMAGYRGTEEHSFIDIDDFALCQVKASPNLQAKAGNQQFLELELFPIIQQEISKYLGAYGKRHFIIVTSNVRLPEYLELKDKRMEVFLPSPPFTEQHATTLDAEGSKLFIASRTEIMLTFGSIAKVYSSFQNLVDSVATAFDLKMKLC